MSWEIAAFAVLGLALVAGFGWYERSHPSAKVLALVGTLAALAALGRIAFAPLPNVKPTTDIVLIAGFALGGAPGFAVGAVGAVASNFFFGQGPWTPWQMAAWGGVGVLGAVLARVTGRRIGRLPLALACGAAGAFYGVILNLATWLQFTGDRSLAQLGAIFAGSLPFDLAHVLGNVAFCFAFGPALLHALARFRERFEVRWRPAPAGGAADTARGGARVAGLLLVLAAGGALSGGAGAPAGADAAAPRATVRYLERAQNRDGGWGPAPGARSTQLHSGWAALGLAAAGRNPGDVRRAGRSVLDYTRAGLGGLGDTGELERTILVLGASGTSPRRFGGRDLVAQLLRRQRRDGSFGGQVAWTAFGVLALRAAGSGPGAGPVRRTGRWLARQAQADGGFSYLRRGGVADADDTGAALQALAAAGRRRTATVRRAVRWLERRQNPDGGFATQGGRASNAQSTAFAIQGLLAAGRDPDRVRRGGGRSALAYLRSLVAPNGSVRYSRSSEQTPVWVTGQALAALARRALPLRPPAGRARRPAAAAAPAAARAAPGSRPSRTAAAAARAVRRKAAARAARRERAARRARAEAARGAATARERVLLQRAQAVGVVVGGLFRALW